MDKYQKRVKQMESEKIIAIAEGYGRLLKFCYILASLFCGLTIIPGLFCAITITNFPPSLAVLSIGGGILFLVVFALTIIDYRKLAEAAIAEASARSLTYKVAERRAERQAIYPVAVLFFVVVALILFGIRGCMGIGMVSCPKCGSHYSTDHPAGEDIKNNGFCASCERDG